ncbi:Dynein heavy chain_ cytoplasmiclike [Caligus rogercresseyi]|uniref:Dynein heavy chain_ cytoplasmiclike n=1 Tax=Caligus rogercresseyi TaxID=217165 RepID=A0A7T8KA46_CALRO|nr:Dynein heavy chain_ cytoplasmiclike [Caligus rogercresseyi]
MFEVSDLKYATLATVSRCGMVWFSEDVLSTEMIFQHFFNKLKSIPLDDEGEEDFRFMGGKPKDKNGLVKKCLEYAATQEHIMDFTRLRALSSLFSMLNQSSDQLERYIPKSLIYSLIWSFTGDSKLKVRVEFCEFIRSATTIPLPPSATAPIIDFDVPQVEVETHKVASPDVVVPTLDTVRHEELLNTWLADHKPIVLCGPPGSGKTMTLFSALRALPDMEVVGLNFSSATSPELLLKTLDHYCEYRKTPNGVVLTPTQLGKWLIMFCDEINLPDMDAYGTQRVISFLRQLIEHNGFYRNSDQAWVTLERIQFVGACNPPTDPGRKPLAHRFLRHIPVVYVDYPGETSLKQIYGTFTRAMLRLIPSLRTYAEPLTNAMVEFYLTSQEKFTQDMQPHYIYSPREMTRWVRGICEAIRPLESLPVEGLVRLFTHEALRLFHDRLVNDEERKWTSSYVDEVALKHFPNINREEALVRPILYSNWMSKNYVPVEQEELRHYVKARLKVFYEEELDVHLVLFNEVLDHVLRIDRIFRQPQGHLLLIGTSGSGKTTLSRFVAWMNGLTVFQIKVHNKYSAEDFDEDLRNVLRRSGCKDEKICFILDESNVMESGFLERMNTLLANGEVPGLFEGDEHTTLMTQCKEGAQRQGLMLDSNEELYKWFTQQVMRNLHVVFTMNPTSDGLKDRAATSPALFNRCVLNWFGDWSNTALYQVGKEFTLKIDLEKSNWVSPDRFPVAVLDVEDVSSSHRTAVNNAMVYIHQTLHATNAKVAKRGGRTMAITPRHFLDFINHFVKLYGEKRAALEEEQLHLNVGLSKIAETVEQVEEMQKSLAVKSAELQTKNEAANAKLKQMVKDQQEAEKQKTQSQEIQKVLELQKVEIAEKTSEVMIDLEKVEPAVIDAQQAVKSIKKQHLVEVRSMSNPPAIVKLALESICLLLGEYTTEWKGIRSVTMKDNFIPTIVNFNTDDITDDVREKMRLKYLSNPDYNYEKVNRASMACGPLVKWAIAQLLYADMLKRVEPLRNELQSLKDAAESKQKHADEMTELIARLEKSINSYKEEYAQLISQAEAIKNDLKHVQDKVDRSMSLLKSLGIEKDRWQETSENFKSQMSTLVGDVFLSSAFLSYAGYFDQQHRQSLFLNWTHHLERANIAYRIDLARTEFLSDPDERLKWQANALPTDDLCTENAIMLKRFNRYPLIIDPSGQATEFILNEYKDRKITKTSFLDDSFRKNLESALRFGNPLLVQDVENYDPILNPVLNRELRRTGGRVLITLGDQDIDLSPTFTIFLSTRDPTVEFPPDICSRVTFVNFTVTRSSLQMQCLNQVLKTERPDIDQKRSDLLKLQGEFQLRLRHLEKELLQCLNEAKGRILDDNTVISTLEKLKEEAAEVSLKASDTEEVMKQIETTSQQYTALASACSSIYFTIDNLHQIHFLYQYSLQFFLDIFHNVLVNNSALNNVTDYAQRLSIITSHLFESCFLRVARGMLHDDRIVFAMLLCRIYLRGLSSENSLDSEFYFLLRGKEAVSMKEKISSLSEDQSQAVIALMTRFSPFKSIVNKLEDPGVQGWLSSPNAEQGVPQMWEGPADTLAASIKAMYSLLLVQALRPDRFIAATNTFVGQVLGEKFTQEKEIDLASVVESQVKASTPILMCSVLGYDASGRVDDLAAELGKGITSIAIGSEEGFNQAEKAINTAVKSGRWVMLKNVHLAPAWLVTLEKKLHSLQPHPTFRLFLTCEINPKIPVNLLRASRIFTFEPPPGIRANLLRTFATIPAARMMKPPNERARLYFTLAWFHAIVQERLRYAPLGWSKTYEFNESDLRVACDMLDTWIDSTSMGRTNLPPEKVPWKAMRTLLCQCIYGGKIDNEFDQRLLNTFLDELFSEKSFEPDFVLIKGSETKSIMMPEGIRRDQFLSWVEQLADRQSPEWLGLPNNAETVLLTSKGHDTIMKLLKMQQIDDDEEEVHNELDESEDTKGGDSSKRPAWMRTLHESASSWLSLLPEDLLPLRRTADNIKDPLYRFFEREVNTGLKILRIVRTDLGDVVDITENKKKQTNYHRSIIADLMRGMIPKSWKQYKIPLNATVMDWIKDFSQRIQQLKLISKTVVDRTASALKSVTVWLGGLFNPEAYITATRQYVSQANSWSLEELYLDILIGDEGETPSLDDFSFGLEKLKLQGATALNNQLKISSIITTDLHITRLRWLRQQDKNKGEDRITLPVYLNATRSDILFTAEFSIAPEQSKHSFFERGVALIASNNLN